MRVRARLRVRVGVEARVKGGRGGVGSGPTDGPTVLVIRPWLGVGCEGWVVRGWGWGRVWE